MVGDGPSREGLQRRFPDVVWRGYRYGDDLAAHFASADCFVFPSRTETFGNVLLEAMASGLPVASVPAPGPVDSVQEGINGAIDDNLLDACLRALRCSREKTRASIERRTLEAGHEVFRQHLVPLQPQTPSSIPPRIAGIRIAPRPAPRGAGAWPGTRPFEMAQGRRNSGCPIWIVALGRRGPPARSSGGREHDDCRPELEPAHLLALAKGRVASDHVGAGIAEVQQHVQEVQPDAGDEDRRDRHERDELARARQARRRIARSFLQNSFSTRLTVIGLVFQVSPET